MTIFLLFLMVPVFAFAYLDPGTGSFIIHVIVGGIVGVSYAIRIFWRNIKNAAYYVIGRHRKDNQENDESSARMQ